MTPDEFLRILLDPARLAVLGSAVAEPVDTVALAEKLSVPSRRVMGAVAKLREAGLLTEGLMLDRAVIQDIGCRSPPVRRCCGRDHSRRLEWGRSRSVRSFKKAS